MVRTSRCGLCSPSEKKSSACGGDNSLLNEAVTPMLERRTPISDGNNCFLQHCWCFPKICQNIKKLSGMNLCVAAAIKSHGARPSNLWLFLMLARSSLDPRYTSILLCRVVSTFNNWFLFRGQRHNPIFPTVANELRVDTVQSKGSLFAMNSSERLQSWVSGYGSSWLWETSQSHPTT